MSSPLLMVSRCRIVMAPRGSPSSRHSATGAGSSSPKWPFCMSTPISVAVTLLPSDQLICGVLRVKPGA